MKFKSVTRILASMSTTSGLIEQSIRDKLVKILSPSHIEIINESYMHNVPKNSETHFKVLVVSNKFKDITLIKVITIISVFCLKILF